MNPANKTGNFGTLLVKSNPITFYLRSSCESVPHFLTRAVGHYRLVASLASTYSQFRLYEIFIQNFGNLLESDFVSLSNLGFSSNLRVLITTSSDDFL